MPLLDHIRPEPNPPLTIERVELARAMYVDGFTASRICAHCLMSLGTLYRCLDGNPFGTDGPRWEPIPRRRNVLGKRTRALRADPVSLRNRLIRTAEGQVREIELRLSRPHRSGPERERDMRMLALAVKSLRELSCLDLAVLRPGHGRAGASAAEPQTPEDVEEMRRGLAERLCRLVEEAREQVP